MRCDDTKVRLGSFAALVRFGNFGEAAAKVEYSALTRSECQTLLINEGVEASQVDAYLDMKFSRSRSDSRPGKVKAFRLDAGSSELAV